MSDAAQHDWRSRERKGLANSLDCFLSRCHPEPNTGCWLWGGSYQLQGGTRAINYGRITHRGVHLKAHRVSWTLHKGSIPAGIQVLHKCDMRLCVNPEHLFLGTNDDNVQDKVTKGRQPQGEDTGHAKLTEDEVREICAARGVSYASLGRRYNINQSVVSDIKRGNIWRYLEVPRNPGSPHRRTS